MVPTAMEKQLDAARLQKRGAAQRLKDAADQDQEQRVPMAGGQPERANRARLQHQADPHGIHGVRLRHGFPHGTLRESRR
jgi:hypothetical protein